MITGAIDTVTVYATGRRFSMHRLMKHVSLMRKRVRYILNMIFMICTLLNISKDSDNIYC